MANNKEKEANSYSVEAPSDSEEIQVVADVHAAQEPPAPEPPASQSAAQGTGAIPKRQTRASASTSTSKCTSSDSDSSVK